jgi:hypothetical protein
MIDKNTTFVPGNRDPRRLAKGKRPTVKEVENLECFIKFKKEDLTNKDQKMTDVESAKLIAKNIREEG